MYHIIIIVTLLLGPEARPNVTRHVLERQYSDGASCIQAVAKLLPRLGKAARQPSRTHLEAGCEVQPHDVRA